jgi:hypothetical protein
MAPTHSELGEASPTTQKVESVLNACDSMISALKTARWARNLLLLGFLAFALGSAYVFYDMYARVRSQENLDRVTQAVQDRLAGQSDTYFREVQSLVDKSTPIVTDAFYTRAKTDLPLLLQGVEKERDQFIDSLKGRVQNVLAEHFDAMVSKNQDLLVKELPEVKDPEIHKRLVANLHVVFERMIKKYYADELNHRLVSMYDAWDRFPAAERIAGDTTRLEDQFIASLLDMLAHKLTDNVADAK